MRKDGEIIYFSARTGRYLETPRGAPNRQLLDMVRRELRLDIRAALRQVMETRRPTQRVNILLDDDEAAGEYVSIRVELLDGCGKGDSEPLFLVVFTPLGPAPRVAEVQRRRRDCRGRQRGT